jgi:hypothetical protein
MKREKLTIKFIKPITPIPTIDQIKVGISIMNFDHIILKQSSH